ncbi:MAG: hypothetical protein UT53_C0041G0003 [Candidatus Yanofskybacteria bacterium GW2011_GWD2_39_48]|uniref:Uncharacterized protein n=1 Tax=Candidatus Yanofskybacteria bacterium GW2011_GWD2_39_48 TaxID=1619031 RepID=A0A0G0S9R0_9BACT|nr:MAG: hypothetical protein UT53_C0041G0003 [Candidatus Yanofskybacteria bacterium GW2011_GWD2_39_48]
MNFINSNIVSNRKISGVISFVIRRKYAVILTLIMLLIASYFIFKPNSISIRTAVASIGRVEQIISATGKVEKADMADLAFDRSGRVSWVGIRVGDRVKSGQILAMLDTGELSAQRMNAVANLDSVKAKMDQILSGARQEDVNIAQINYDNALKNLNNAKTKNSLDVIRNALNGALNAMVSYTDIQYVYFSDNSNDSTIIANQKEDILQYIFKTSQLGRTNSWYFLNLKSGLIDSLNRLDQNYNADQIKLLLGDTKTALYRTKDGLDIMYSKMNGVVSTEAEKTKISNAKTSILSQISSLISQEQTITMAEASFNNAEAQLNLKKAPATEFDITMAMAQVTQAEAGLALIDAQISKNLIRSPIGGIVASSDIQRGEISSPGKVVITILGDSNYEITANIPEADITKVRVDNVVKVTLDAFGQDVIWQAKVTSIYPSEKMIEGVPTYETKIQFDVNGDERIKTGLTANLEITNAIKDNIINVPSRSIYEKDGQKFVKVVVQNDDNIAMTRFANLSETIENKKTIIYEVPISVGLKGSDGKTEIIFGIEEGDNILIQ